MQRFLLLPLVLSLLGLWLSACSTEKNGKESNGSYLPPARGEANVILVVMDTAQWQGPLGEQLKDIFSEYVPGLPQSEPYFKIRNINPLKLNNILKTAKNMIFLSTLNNNSQQGQKMMEYFTDESLEKIKSNTGLYMQPLQNQWANGQEILHLFGQDQEQLLKNLSENKSQLRNYFLTIENSRVASSLFKVREKGIEKKLADEYGFKFNVPYGYDLAKSLKDFVWVRMLDPEFEKNIFVYFKPYDTKDPFDDVLAFRESITSTYMRDIEKPQIYMTVQGENGEYHTIKEVNFKSMYAKETRGLWMLNDISSGGPYVSYVFVDESQKRMYYLEGYVYAPSQDKRLLMQEMEVILQTFVSGESLKS